MPPVTVCGQQRAPLAQPPAGSPPVVLFVGALLRSTGRHLGDRAADLRLLHPGSKTSQPSQGIWIPYDESIEQIIRDDFKRLLAPPMDFLDNLSIEVSDRRDRCGLRLPQRHDREDHRLQHGGARAHQDRSRLRGEQEARAVEDRRGAQADERRNPARHASSTRRRCARSKASSAT